MTGDRGQPVRAAAARKRCERPSGAGQYDAVLFDMDGVTVETAAIWRELEREEILPAAVEGEVPWREVRARSPTDAYRRLDAMPEVTLAVDESEFRELYDARAEVVYRRRAALMDGYRRLVAGLRAQDLHVGLVTASLRDWVEMVFDRFDLHAAYDVVVTASDLDAPSKPHPAAYVQAASHLDVSPDRCIAVEDSTHGITAAREAGMYCIAVRGDGNDRSDLSTANEVVADSRALQHALARLVTPTTA